MPSDAWIKIKVAIALLCSTQGYHCYACCWVGSCFWHWWETWVLEYVGMQYKEHFIGSKYPIMMVFTLVKRHCCACRWLNFPRHVCQQLWLLQRRVRGWYNVLRAMWLQELSMLSTRCAEHAVKFQKTPYFFKNKSITYWEFMLIDLFTWRQTSIFGATYPIHQLTYMHC